MAFFIKEARQLSAVPQTMEIVPAIQKAFQVSNQAVLTPDELEELEKREIYIHDMRGALIKARREGREEGREEGRREMAQQMKAEGLSSDLIEKITGLPMDEMINQTKRKLMNKKIINVCRLIIVLIGLLIYTLIVQAQFSDDIDITLTADAEEFAIGDLITLTLQVKHPAGYQAVIPQLPSTWGDYEIRVQRNMETSQNDDGSETTQQTIEVMILALGTFQTPSFSVSLRDVDGELIERVVPQLSLMITPILAPDDNELRDIKPQAEIPLLLPWVWIVIGALVGLAMVFGLWKLYQRLKSRDQPHLEPLPTLPTIDTRPAYIIAYEELERIDRLDLPGQGRFKEYYSLVTDCLRVYLGGMYQIPAIDLTTDETKKALQQTSLSQVHRKTFVDVFSEGDFVKFARFVPTIDMARRLLDRARSLVDETKIDESKQDEELGLGVNPRADETEAPTPETA